MRKKAVVFGGSGFIGSYLVDELIAKGFEVVAADIYCSDYVDRAAYTFCDITDEKSVDNIVAGAQIVYNLAGVAGLDDAIENPKRAIELNVVGNLNVLESAKRHHVERFVYASSAYAMSEKGSFYGISKLTSEKLVEEYYKKYGLKFTIIRYGSIYGERDYENNYIFNLVKEAMKTGQINHSGDGEEIREYIHAEDVAKLACEVAADEQFVNEHIILTGMERMPRIELFLMIKEMLGGNLEVNLNDNGYHNHYKVTPYSFQPTLSKKVVPNPFIDLGQGILKCMQEIDKS